MDQKTTQVCIHHNSLNKAIDQAIWLNHLVRREELNPFSVLEVNDNTFLVVSPDYLGDHSKAIIHPIPETCSGLDYDELSVIRKDIDILPHWERITGIFAVADTELLQFIITRKVPLETLIRYELSIRGYDENNLWCGFDRSKSIWQKPNSRNICVTN